MKYLSKSRVAATLVCIYCGLGAEKAMCQPRALSPAEVLKQIRAADHAVSQGRIEFEQKAFRGRSSLRFVHNYAYQEDLKFRDEYRVFGKDVPNTKLTYIFDGQDSFTISSVRIPNDSVSIEAGKPKDFSPSSFALGMYPVPCFAMGRGLSALTNLNVAIQGDTAVVTGSAPRNTLVRAVVDLKRNCLMRSARLSDGHGNKLFDWKMSGGVGNNAVTARAVLDEKWLKGTYSYDALYNIKGVVFSKQSPAEFQYPITGKLTIVDNRLGGSVVIIKEGADTISKEDLLKQTRRNLQLKSWFAKQTALVGKIQNSMNYLVLLLPILFFGLWFSLKRKRKSKSSSQAS